MTTKRTYGESCAAAHALDLVGERWALLIVRELILGPKRFTDLRAGILHASSNVLAQRLRELEEAAVVRRRKLPPPAAATVYELTDWGQELEPVLAALGHWGARSPHRPPDAGMSLDATVLALRTMFSPAAAKGLRATYALQVGEHAFRVRIAGGRMELERGEAPDPDATLEADQRTLGALALTGLPLTEALAAGTARVTGDEAALERFLTLFPLPEPAAAAAA
jgi:DNA-binding HxlR family transcriptional regulator/putative sterol carrier protein